MDVVAALEDEARVGATVVARVRVPAARRHEAIVDARRREEMSCSPAIITLTARPARLPDVVGERTHFIARINFFCIVVEERRARDVDRRFVVREHFFILAVSEVLTAVLSAKRRGKNDGAVFVLLILYIPLSAADVAREYQLGAKTVGGHARAPFHVIFYTLIPLVIRVTVIIILVHPLRVPHLTEVVVLDEDVAESGAISLVHGPDAGVVVARIPVHKSTSE